MLKILVVEGNVKEARDQSVDRGSLAQGDLYVRVLKTLANDVTCQIVYPADGDKGLPSTTELAEFDGIVWTGSALNIYDGGTAIERQVDFMRRCLEQETRIFGSCWGLQVAAVAAGGKVAANVKGREIGIARDILVTKQGLSHPLYRGKPEVFDAVAVHLDHVTAVPEGSCVLARNHMSDVQAIEIRHALSVFWGVQYHPEFDLEYIADVIRKYEKALIKEGISADAAAVEAWAMDMEAAHCGGEEDELKQQYKLSEDVLDPASRLREISNWLDWLREQKAESRAL